MFRLTSLIFLSFINFSKEYLFPIGIEKCAINDDDCVLKSARDMIQKYKNGYTDMNLVNLDPMPLENFVILKKGGPVTLDYFTESSQMFGLANATILKFQGFDQNFLEIEMKFPALTFNGTYRAKAKMLGMSLNGNGIYACNFKNFDLLMKFNLTRVQKDEKEFFKIEDSGMTFEFSESIMNFPDLGHFANWLINASTKLLLEALRDATSEMWAADFEEKLQHIFDTVSINELFLK